MPGAGEEGALNSRRDRRAGYAMRGAAWMPRCRKDPSPPALDTFQESISTYTGQGATPGHQGLTVHFFHRP